MRRIFALLAVLALTLALFPGGVATAVTQGQPLVFHEITPCALFDTRPSQGGTGIMAAGETRTFHVVGSASDFASQGGVAGGCGIPGFSEGQPQTQMVYLNLVAVDPVQGGNLKVWATTDPEPAGGVVNYQKLTPNFNNSNAIVVGVRQDTEGNDLTVKANVGSVHVRGVALGYLSTASKSFWALGGNAGTTGSHFIGTTDNQPLHFRVNGHQALRLEPAFPAPNVIGGSVINSASGGVIGATIGGGGCPAPECGPTNRPNQVTANLGTVGGGQGNAASGVSATVGGGGLNTAGGGDATVGGGFNNIASGEGATVAGGQANTASAGWATVGGGSSNTASGFDATVGGGFGNTASGPAATVGGGSSNTASGSRSFAAGNRAKANHDGAFVWADSTNADFASGAVNEFAVRAGGGIRISAPFLSSIGNAALDIRVNDGRVLRLEPGSTPNIIGGHFGNSTPGGVLGATIGGGGLLSDPNQVTANLGTVGGGSGNIAGGSQSTVGGGGGNSAAGTWTTVPGGILNAAEGLASFAAGRRAKANHDGAFVWADSTNADFASGAVNEFAVRAGGGVRFVVGGNTCTLDPGTGTWTGPCASPAQAWLLGGNAGTNQATQFVGTTDNVALNLRVNNARAFRLEPGSTPNVIGGFSGNSVTAGALGATIGGGGTAFATNRVTDEYGTIGGGHNNRAGDDAGTTVDQSFATVGGGSNNTASGNSATVGGGLSNTASGALATVAGGQVNTASGFSATVAGGEFNTAAGPRSFAAGRRAKANHDGTFVWADNTDADMASSANNQFIARAAGRFFLQSDSTLDNQGGFINTSTGAFLSNTGVWTNASDAALKTGFTPVDPAGVLDRVADMPITSWSYRGEPGVAHIGPTAQDFHAAFGLGSDDKTIGTVDADGVALAAIQGLNERFEAEIASREGGGSGSPVLPTGAWVALAMALGLLGLGLGRRWERRTAAA